MVSGPAMVVTDMDPVLSTDVGERTGCEVGTGMDVVRGLPVWEPLSGALEPADWPVEAGLEACEVDRLVEVAVVDDREVERDTVARVDEAPKVGTARVSVTVRVETEVETKVDTEPGFDVVTIQVSVVREMSVEIEMDTEVETLVVVAVTRFVVNPGRGPLWLLVDDDATVRVVGRDGCFVAETGPEAEATVDDDFHTEVKAPDVVVQEKDKLGVVPGGVERVRVDEPP